MAFVRGARDHVCDRRLHALWRVLRHALAERQLVRDAEPDARDLLREPVGRRVHDLPGVGANLIDHYVIRIVNRVQGTPTVNEIARFPRVRDRAIFVGAPEDVVPDAFGDGLPLIRPWVE